MEAPNTNETELPDGGRNQNWQNNHIAIMEAIDFLSRENERMPTQGEIAKETGLSRKTVNVHLQECKLEKPVTEALEQFEFMASKVLSRVMLKAIDGDMRASRLSLQIMGILGKPRG